jgi:DNA repair protein RadC
MMFYGAERLADSELLALLIGGDDPGRPDTLSAHEVLCMEESGIAYLPECTPHELMDAARVGKSASCRIAAAVEIGKRLAARPKTERVRISSPEDIANMLMPEMRYLKNECFRVLLLNIKGEITATEEVSVGNLNSSVADPREVFRPAVRRGSASVILAHNHPSGNPTPSVADTEATGRLMTAGEILGIRVIDHIVIGDGTFVSMRQENLLKNNTNKDDWAA